MVVHRDHPGRDVRSSPNHSNFPNLFFNFIENKIRSTEKEKKNEEKNRKEKNDEKKQKRKKWRENERISYVIVNFKNRDNVIRIRARENVMK